MHSGFPNPLQDAVDVIQTSLGGDSTFQLRPAQLMFREFQTIAIQIDAEARAGNRHFYHLWSREVMGNVAITSNFQKLIIFQLEKRGYIVLIHSDNQIYIAW